MLHEAALGSHDLTRTLELFGKDMGETPDAAPGFFERYLGGDAGVEFAIDYGHLCAKLTQRISKEEKILYEEYAKLSTDPRGRAAGTAAGS